MDGCSMSMPLRSCAAARTLSWGFILAVLFVGKAIGLLAAWFVAPEVLTLGDRQGYLSGAFLAESGEDIYAVGKSGSTNLVGTLAHTLATVGGDWLSDAVFSMMSLAGFLLILRHAQGRLERWQLLLATCLPSFMLWTSQTSKEAFFTLAVALIFDAWLQAYRDGRWSLWSLAKLLVGMPLIMFKPTFYLGLLGAWFVFRGGHYLGVSDARWRVAAFAACLGACLPLVWEDLEWLAAAVAVAFDSETARTTREAPWNDAAGFLMYAPVGVIIAFFGPTPLEIWEQPSGRFLLAGFENLALAVGLIMLYRGLWRQVADPAVRYGALSLLILFAIAHYPYGVMNPGSAIRYRSCFLPDLLLLLAVLPAVHQQRSWQQWQLAWRRSNIAKPLLLSN